MWTELGSEKLNFMSQINKNTDHINYTILFFKLKNSKNIVFFYHKLNVCQLNTLLNYEKMFTELRSVPRSEMIRLIGLANLKVK